MAVGAGERRQRISCGEQISLKKFFIRKANGHELFQPFRSTLSDIDGFALTQFGE
jgi:hypothetical protein